MSSKAKTLLNTDEDAEFLKSLKEDFYVETLDSFEKSEAILLDFEETKNELKKLEYKRILHSVKGSAKAVGEDLFAKIVHEIEDSVSCVTVESMDFQLNFLDASSGYIKLRMNGKDADADATLAELEKKFKTK